MEIVPEGKLVESEDELKLYQHNNGDLKDKYKQEKIFEDLEEGELSENTQRLAGLSILEKFNDAYDKIFCFSSSTDLLIKIKELHLDQQMTPRIKMAYRKTYQNMKERNIM
ncbi:hypothetical protein O181_031548 [Austropuccinia psidii MF-1]|uniref:Uncharacterized protein n=1 Tax=Austropuccinia psidii MF-1 TaxID=1389203 RepID=A0A9Q3CZX1_9BASI|nr:hypothetical protein [Austropuccinia psidii MF-1]